MSIYAGWNGYTYSWNTISEYCMETAVYTQTNSGYTVTSIPDHVRVVVHNYGYTCGGSGPWVSQLVMKVVNPNNIQADEGYSVQEFLTNFSGNSCPGGASPPAQSCLSLDYPSAQFTDQAQVTGNYCGGGITSGMTCGYTIDSQWKTCFGTNISLWNYHGDTKANNIKYSGNYYPSGTYTNVNAFMSGTQLK